ncbi:MAG: hypothetical protein U9O87_02565 [Verrucomicrobiota bacterium]|nr:hypothetical protein [Verrucomicrobiota bacterium]
MNSTTVKKRPAYDCDTSPYWCTDEDYNNKEKTFGKFIENGDAYQITDKNTPRPWLNYFCNEHFASCLSNTGLGFTWYKTSLLRITKYEHPIDYLPRDFKDGREVIVTDKITGKSFNFFRTAKDITCIHRSGYSVISATQFGIQISLTVFVPVKDSAECWLISVKNKGSNKRDLQITLEQTWTFSKFGIHTAEEGIPYLTIPGKDLDVYCDKNSVNAISTNKNLPFDMYGLFMSPEADIAESANDSEKRKDGRIFNFKICRIKKEFSLDANKEDTINILSAATENKNECDEMKTKYSSASVFATELEKVKLDRKIVKNAISCSTPDKNFSNFLNVWLKNQLYLTFRFIRSGYIGYRDTLQDTWGYTLIDIEISRKQILKTLAHMLPSGACPRNYSPVDDKHDLREFMDSGTWIPMTLLDYIKETNDFSILDEQLPYLNSDKKDSVNDHVWKALELLYLNRGVHGMCLTGDGDWNDALEGISKCGDAESVWLTVALFHAQNLMAELYKKIGDTEKIAILSERSENLRKICQEKAWDGEWFIYGFTGTGKPIGSKINKEGKIHLNVQSWAVFTGLATEEQTKKLSASVSKYLDTPLGPELMYPGYVDEADEVGRIANLEPGTFENASIYQHAVAFAIFADSAMNNLEKAFRTFVNLLPTNPDNFDCRRSSEPYATGNYYCGKNHPRYGQNFFTWFTGNPAWLLRAGFENILGVKAQFEGLQITPSVPKDWDNYCVIKLFRGINYKINFIRSNSKNGIYLDEKKLCGDIIPQEKAEKSAKTNQDGERFIEVTVFYNTGGK